MWNAKVGRIVHITSCLLCIGCAIGSKRLRRDIELDRTSDNYGLDGELDGQSFEGRRLADVVYTRLTFDQIQTELELLRDNYPQFVTLFTSQEKYGLPSSCKPSEAQHGGCYNPVLVIEDKKMYEKDDANRAKAELPDVYLSGALHGDERVGPVAMVEMAKLLVKAATCQAKIFDNITKQDCKNMKKAHSLKQLSWLARLVSTRRIVITPTTNAKGYYFNSRSETYKGSFFTEYLDPNRDFPFDQSSSKCMRTIAGRTCNELFLDHLFQMSMTFHGGIELIGFEWGALVMPGNKISPDDNGQRILSSAMAEYAGELSSNELYTSGDMNSILYGVRGGMEDWVYASSWRSENSVQCNPSTYGGYPTSKTTYDDATVRTFNILVETSNSKNPQSSSLGSDKGLLKPPFNFDNNENNGYVSKTIRTGLMAIDTVQPYVEIESVGKKRFKTDLKPTFALSTFWCKKKKKIAIKTSTTTTLDSIKIKWSVGGAFNVDETFLVYGSWSQFPESFNCMNQLTEDEMEEVLMNTDSNFYITPAQTNGDTRWTNPNSSKYPSFKATLDLSSFSSGTNVAVFAVAKVDQNWKEQNMSSKGIWPSSTSPQSHMVNVRTNPEYRMEKTSIGKVVQGRLHWLSIPVSIKLK